MVGMPRPALLLIAVALAGCGGSESGGSQSDAENQRDTARTKLERCLDEQGVDLEDGRTPKLQRALEGPCKAHRTGAFGDLSEEEQQEAKDRRLRFRACMEDQGIDMSDPSKLDAEDPRVEKARDACM
jgi:hypothetical protein